MRQRSPAVKPRWRRSSAHARIPAQRSDREWWGWPNGERRQRPYATNTTRSPTVRGINPVPTPMADIVITVAPAMMIVSPTAARSVRPRLIPRVPGRTRPSAPSISATPMKRRNAPGSETSFVISSIGMTSFMLPENKYTTASSHCTIHSTTFKVRPSGIRRLLGCGRVQARRVEWPCGVVSSRGERPLLLSCGLRDGLHVRQPLLELAADHAIHVEDQADRLGQEAVRAVHAPRDGG